MTRKKEKVKLVIILINPMANKNIRLSTHYQLGFLTINDFERCHSANLGEQTVFFRWQPSFLLVTGPQNILRTGHSSVFIIQFEVAVVPECDEEDDVEEDGPHGPGVRTGQPGPTHLHIKHY